MLKVKQKLMDEEGMTLVELLAAIVILSIIVVSFLVFFTQSAQTNSRTDTNSEAAFLIQGEVERIIYCSQNDFTVNDTLHSVPDTHVVTIEKEEETGLYEVVVNLKGGPDRERMETYLSFPAGIGE